MHIKATYKRYVSTRKITALPIETMSVQIYTVSPRTKNRCSWRKITHAWPSRGHSCESREKLGEELLLTSSQSWEETSGRERLPHLSQKSHPIDQEQSGGTAPYPLFPTHSTDWSTQFREQAGGFAWLLPSAPFSDWSASAPCFFSKLGTAGLGKGLVALCQYFLLFTAKTGSRVEESTPCPFPRPSLGKVQGVPQLHFPKGSYKLYTCTSSGKISTCEKFSEMSTGKYEFLFVA